MGGAKEGELEGLEGSRVEEEARVEEEQGHEEERKESRAGEGGEWGQGRLERKERLVESRARERLRLYRG